MQKYLELISRLLEKEKTACFLPGIGMLQFKEEPAKVDTGKGHLYPPHTYIVLERTENPLPPYHSVIQEIKRSFGLSDEEAGTEWGKTIEHIKKLLATEGRVRLPGIGRFVLNDQQVLTFVESPERYMLYPKVAYLSPSPAAIPPGIEEESDYVGSTGKKSWIWLLTLGIIILAGVGFFLYKYQNTLFPVTGESESTTDATTANQVKPELSNPLKDTTVGQKETPSGVEASDSIHFAVIYTVYHSQKTAERHYKQMQAWGHNVSVYSKDSVTYQLGYPYYELPADTAKRLKEIKKLYGGNPYIIYPEK